MGPCPTQVELDRFLEEELDDARRHALEGHVQDCVMCQEALDRLTTDTGQRLPTPAEAVMPANLLTLLKHAAVGPPVVRSDVVPEVPGYELLGLLGRGGMGIVYRARHRALNRVVALKLLRADAVDANQFALRLQAEAEALARLDHPNVVRVHEFGESPQLYLALEYVPGGSLAEHLKRGRLEPREAARLLEGIARGAHAAHQVGVIHRDLKPANILLGIADCRLQIADLPEREHEPSQSAICNLQSAICKITDFGIAKRLDVPGLTRTGLAVGTPYYMSPEQARGEVVGAASDIHALGAIFYELLTGAPPFVGPDPAAVLLQVVHDKPVPPGRRVLGVPVDLETICLKCLRKEPGQRYTTAEELADDLRRYLDGEPIRARSVGRAERTWLWARRHPGVALLSAGLTGTVLAALVVVSQLYLRAENLRRDAETSADEARASAVVAQEKQQEAEANERRAVAGEAEARRQRDRADIHLEQAHQVVEKFCQRVGADPTVGSSVRRDLLASALPFYEQFTLQAGDSPRTRTDRGRAYHQLLLVRQQTGDLEGAVRDGELAVRTFAQLMTEFPAEPTYQDRLAQASQMWGSALVALAPRPENAAPLERALGVFEALADRSPSIPQFRHGAANCLMVLGQLASQLGDHAGAIRRLERATERLATLHDGNHPEADTYRQDEASCLSNLGIVQSTAGRLTHALATFRRADGLWAEVRRGRPRAAAVRQNYGIMLSQFGLLLLQLQSFEEARAVLDRSVGLHNGLVDDYSSVPVYQLDLARALANRAKAAWRLRRPMEAETDWRKAADLLRPVVTAQPTFEAARSYLGTCLNGLGVLALDRGNLAEAEKNLVAAEELWIALQTAAPANPDHATQLSVARTNLARLERARGRAGEALAWTTKAEEVVTGFPRYPDAVTARVDALQLRADLLAVAGRHAELLGVYRLLLSLTSGKLRTIMSLRLAVSLLAERQAREAAGLLDTLDTSLLPSAVRFEEARLNALCAADLKEVPDVAERCAARAVTRLRELHRAGQLKGTPADLVKDSTLESLRGRADFREFVGQPPEEP